MTQVCVVLVEPQGSINIGSVCRSMMNFGVSDLRLVKPCEDYNGFNARRMALKAKDILDRASVYDSVLEAIQDCGLIFGTTRRFGKYRNEKYFLSPEQAAERASFELNTNNVAYVFGREDSGLRNTELEVCSFYVTILTNDLYKSMNLSHAVSLCMYQLHKECVANILGDKEILSLADCKDTERMFKHMKKTLLNIGYLNPENPDHIVRTFRRILNRSGLTDRDVRVFQGLWSRIDWIEGEYIKHVSKRSGS